MLPSLMIIDDFLSDPWAARRAALALDYVPPGARGNYPGRDSTKRDDLDDGFDGRDAMNL